MTERDGNGAGKVTIEIDVSMVPAIADALSLAANTALLCGSKATKDRFLSLAAALYCKSPIPRGHHAESYSWHEACLASLNAGVVAVKEVPGISWSAGGQVRWSNVEVVADDRVFRVAHEINQAKAVTVVERIEEALSAIVGYHTCVLGTRKARAVLSEDIGKEWSEARLGLVQEAIRRMARGASQSGSEELIKVDDVRIDGWNDDGTSRATIALIAPVGLAKVVVDLLAEDGRVLDVVYPTRPAP